MSSVRSRFAGVLVMFAVSLPVTTAEASIVTLDFTGTVTSLPDPTGVFTGAKVGDAFSVTLVYDTSTVAYMMEAGVDQYWYSPSTNPLYAAPLGISIALDGVTISPRYAGVLNVLVENDLTSTPTSTDAFVSEASVTSPGAGITNPLIELVLGDTTGTAFSSTALPTSLDPTHFNYSSFRLFNNQAGNVFDIFTGTLNTNAVVPEPSSLALSGMACLASLGIAIRRRGKTAA